MPKKLSGTSLEIHRFGYQGNALVLPDENNDVKDGPSTITAGQERMEPGGVDHILVQSCLLSNTSLFHSSVTQLASMQM